MITHQSKKFIKYYPQHMILISIVATVVLGALLLAHPAARTQSISIIDLLFTSASLTTVSGIFTVPIDQFTHTGHLIMLILMQLGGLGLMTMSLFIMYLFSNLGVYTQVIASEILSLKSFKDTKKILFFMFKMTMIIEGIGALAIFPMIYQSHNFGRAVFLSIFHSVSSFCNIGVSLFGHDIATYIDNPTMMFVTCALMVIGGLGFVTWHELLARYSSKKGNKLISWHTKLVLKVYGMTTLFTIILFWILERHNTLAGMSLSKQFYVVVFTSIAMKSTGFQLLSFTTVHLATLLLAMLVMFVGSAPLSTGSGIKTSVFAIYFAVIKAAIQGKEHASLLGRHLIDEQVYKAMAIIMLSMSWIVGITFCMLITEPSYHFIDILFSVVSAFSNNGITTSIIPNISSIGKIFMIATMIIGRIGALAIILSMKRIGDTHELSYPKERVIL